MKKILSVILCIGLGLGILQAQNIEISGRVVEANSQAPIEFATVKLLDAETGQMLAGTTSEADGSLLLISQDATFTLEISFIGFLTQKISD